MKMLETIKNWSDQESGRIIIHNAALELIKSEVLMTVQQMIAGKDEKIAKLKAKLAALKKKTG